MGFESSSLQNIPQSNRHEKPSAPEFDVEEAERILGGVSTWESLEKELRYLVYVPMSNGEKVSADDWIRRIDHVRNGGSIKLITTTGTLRATVERLIGMIGR